MCISWVVNLNFQVYCTEIFNEKWIQQVGDDLSIFVLHKAISIL